MEPYEIRPVRLRRPAAPAPARPGRPLNAGERPANLLRCLCLGNLETMPTYQYQCTAGHEFELFQKISEKPRTKCPTCGARASRVISGGAGLIFKGSGFYITDYGKDGKGPRKEAEGGEPSAKPAAETKADVARPADPKPAASSSSGKSKKARKDHS